MSIDYLSPSFSSLRWITRKEMIHIASKYHSKALLNTGLLTDMIKQLIGECAQIKVIREEFASGALHRVVELHGGNNLLVIAYSFFPESTILEYPWLKSLGMHPLGKALHSRGYISRSDFEFARTHWIYTNHDGSTSSTDTWARKYRFLLEPGDIELIELLCPQFLFEVGRQC